MSIVYVENSFFKECKKLLDASFVVEIVVKKTMKKNLFIEKHNYCHIAVEGKNVCIIQRINTRNKYRQ